MQYQRTLLLLLETMVAFTLVFPITLNDRGGQLDLPTRKRPPGHVNTHRPDPAIDILAVLDREHFEKISQVLAKIETGRMGLTID